MLVEGWFYVMAIPFNLVQSIGAVPQAAHSTPGDFFATSTRSLIRIELTESTSPLFISPSNFDEFLKYCANHVIRLKRGTASGVPGGAASSSTGHTPRSALGQTQLLAAAAHTPLAPAHKP
jgi:hypothetical protein